MRLLLILCLWSFSASAQTDLLADIRANISSIFQDSGLCSRFEARFEKVDVSTNAILKGYKGSVFMAQGRHASNPFTKLSVFNKGKALLDEAIKMDGKNLELRFLRLTIQVNVPGILNYSDQIEEDHAFINKNLAAVSNPEFKKQVTAFLTKAKAQGKL